MDSADVLEHILVSRKVLLSPEEHAAIRAGVAALRGTASALAITVNMSPDFSEQLIERVARRLASRVIGT